MSFGAPSLIAKPDLLTEQERKIYNALQSQIRRNNKRDAQLDAYYEGTQRLHHLGLAVPPQLRAFETVINIPRMAVFLIMPGEETDSPDLRRIYDDNNLESSLPMLWTDQMLFGRGYATVATDAKGKPSIAIEHAPDVAINRDVRTHEITSALRLYRNDTDKVEAATLYLPNRTILLNRDRGLTVERRIEHTQGVPMVALSNL